MNYITCHSLDLEDAGEAPQIKFGNMIVCTTSLSDIRKYIVLHVYDTTLPTYSHC